ncbi:hypothetical protein [uncultured Sphaerochaeta sp.]|uniref:hypothetical protein n=1 Tax=uncultured Sphaerochaeta sp. TaxID=886478 RepID=UPI002AA71B31|nr:hypothetical protein [uncultured Sphaerochaeta sp.]
MIGRLSGRRIPEAEFCDLHPQDLVRMLRTRVLLDHMVGNLADHPFVGTVLSSQSLEM